MRSAFELARLKVEPAHDARARGAAAIYREILKTIGRSLDLRIIVDVVAGSPTGGINGVVLRAFAVNWRWARQPQLHKVYWPTTPFPSDHSQNNQVQQSLFGGRRGNEHLEKRRAGTIRLIPDPGPVFLHALPRLGLGE